MIKGLLLLLSLLPLLEAAPKSLRFGFLPYMGASHLIERYTPLSAHLSKAIGTPVEIIISKNYEEHLEMTGKDQFDISFLGGSPYVSITQKYGKKPLLARYAFKGSPTFRSVIFVSKDASLTHTGALKGKKFAFGSKNSTLSTQVPLFMLLEAGVPLEQLGAFTFLSNQENAILGVLLGEYDAGACSEEIFEEHKKQGIKALAYSPEVSTHLFVASAQLPKKLFEQIQNALLQLHTTKEGMQALRAIAPDLDAFVPVQDSDYDGLRAILKRVTPILDAQP